VVELRKILNSKLSASSIVEVTVAVVISFIVFNLAIGIYLNLASSGSSYDQIKAEMIIKEKYVEMLNGQNFISWVDEKENLIISCTARKLEAKRLIQLEFEARNQNGKLLASSKHLVILQHER
jgi:hypothetical protein